jgi:hypothetical protein
MEIAVDGVIDTKNVIARPFSLKNKLFREGII